MAARRKRRWARRAGLSFFCFFFSIKHGWQPTASKYAPFTATFSQRRLGLTSFVNGFWPPLLIFIVVVLNPCLWWRWLFYYLPRALTVWCDIMARNESCDYLLAEWVPLLRIFFLYLNKMLILSSHEHYIIRDIIGGLRLYRIKLCLKMRKRIRRDYTQYSLIFLFKSRG